jgi:hypothetical protein
VEDSLDGDNLEIFCYLSASDIWPDKRCGFGRSGLIRGVSEHYSLLPSQPFFFSYIMARTSCIFNEMIYALY